jgi:4'-phosphopantetheinyl transferase
VSVHFAWCLTSQVHDGDTTARCAGLDEHERDQLSGMSAQRRIAYLGSRALARQLLSRCLGPPRHPWKLLRATSGRLSVADHDVEISISHTPGLVACAVSRRHAIGIDVENLELNPGVERLFNPFATAEEHRVIAECDSALRRQHFFDLWTLKEAYGKALGIGLGSRVRHIQFHLVEGRPPQMTCPEGVDDPERWWFFSFSPTSTYDGALAVRLAEGSKACLAVMHRFRQNRDGSLSGDGDPAVVGGTSS